MLRLTHSAARWGRFLTWWARMAASGALGGLVEALEGRLEVLVAVAAGGDAQALAEEDGAGYAGEATAKVRADGTHQPGGVRGQVSVAREHHLDFAGFHVPETRSAFPGGKAAAPLGSTGDDVRVLPACLQPAVNGG